MSGPAADLARLGRDIEELKELTGTHDGEIEQLQADLQRVTSRGNHPRGSSSGRGRDAAAGDAEPADLVYPTSESWVAEFFVQVFIREQRAFRWCHKWWLHPEALLRFEALWRTWEHKHLDPVDGISSWLREDLDPAMRVLGASDGPFGSCGYDMHSPTRTAPMPVMRAPAGYLEPLTTPS